MCARPVEPFKRLDVHRSNKCQFLATRKLPFSYPRQSPVSNILYLFEQIYIVVVEVARGENDEQLY